MTPETEEKPNDVDSSGAALTPTSPGAIIRRARERAGLTLEDLAAQTKLTRHALDALERDDFGAMLEPVYVRGYYRKCAKVLDVPEKHLLDSYEVKVAPRLPAAPSKLRLASGTDLGSGSRLPVSIAIVIALIAVILVSVAWFAREQQRSLPPSVAARAGTAPTPAIPVKDSDAVADDTASPPVVAPVIAPAPAESPVSTTELPPPAAVANPAAAPESTVTPTATAAVKPATSVPAATASSGSGAVKIAVNSTSWVRVDDAAGKTLYNDLVRAGEERSISGAIPLSVFLGNAPGVAVEFDGKAIDFTKLTRDNNTARFTLPLPGAR